MRKLRALWMRVPGTLSRRNHEEFEDELAFHLDRHVQDGIRSGLSAEEARRQALIRLGGLDQTRQAWRDRNGLPYAEAIGRDTLYGFRWLRKHRGVTLAAVFSIGLGIGANVTIFSMVNRFLLRPAPVGDAGSLLRIETVQTGGFYSSELSFPLYQDILNQARSFSAVAAYVELIPASIGGRGEPERVWGQAVTTNFFDVTQLRMALGRGFAQGEDHNPEVVLGHALWRRRFNGDPDVIGKAVPLSGHNFTVVGVAPVGFHSVDQLLNTEFWVPLRSANTLSIDMGNPAERDHQWLAVIGRLRPGTSGRDANSELQTLAARLAQSYPNTNKQMTFAIHQAGTLPMRERGQVEIFLSALLVVVLLVLAIAAANVANLLLAQAASRQRDMAVHLALGATRGRLRRQMLMESLMLGIVGGVLGVGLAVSATRSLSSVQLPLPIPLDINFAVDWRVLLFAFALSIVSGLLLGAVPAWVATRPMLMRALKGEEVLSRSRRRISLRNVLLAGQIAMSVILLSLTGLFLRSLMTATTIDIGFHPHGVVMLSVDPRLHGYSPERTVLFLNQLQQRVTSLPGVVSAACTDLPPLSVGGRSDGLSVGGKSGESEIGTDLYMATPGFFATMGVPLIAGREFGNEPPGGAIRAVVNRAFAEHVFAGKNPLGEHVSGAGRTYEIVGVIGSMKSRTLGEETRPVLYRDLSQSIGGDPSFLGYTIVVRTSADAAALIEPVRRQIAALDPTLAVFNVETMDEHICSAYFLPRLAATLFGVFGGIGLVLAAVGLYGVMSYSVSRRTREIGIRMALGAQPRAVGLLFLRHGIVLTLISIALGWPAAWIISKLVRSFLYGIQPHDAPTFTTVPIVLAAVALAACWIPARRASLVDPAETLRTE